jgi:nicotinate-nucleotide--dimethylbenzimidazole phosphoribosyltransferase
MNGAFVLDFATIRQMLGDLAPVDDAAAAEARARDAQLTKPAGSLGRLEDIAAWMAAWQGRHPPRAEALRTLVFAGNHGVAARGVSAFPAEVTVQMVANFEAGGAAINQLCRSLGAELSVDAFDLDSPTADFTTDAAMSEAGCAAAFATGMARVEAETDLLCLGEMGIANSTSAAALATALFGGEPADWVGRGTGVDNAGLARKRDTIAAAMAFHGAALGDPLEALRRLGGYELAAIAGAILGARRARVPVMLDGFICCAAAAVLYLAAPGALDHCLASHRSAEAGHDRLLKALSLSPLLDLGMRLGEASGAALAAHLVKAAVTTHAGMATFADAGVSEG